MSATRVGGCTVKGCPAPRDPDWHRCFVCKSDTIEHHHVQPRGMGGSKVRSGPENVVALCHREHEAVTTHECSDRILDLPGKGRTYVYYDVRGKVLGERVLEAGSAAATEDVAEGCGAQAGAKDGGLKGATFESSVLPVSNKASDDVAAAPSTSGESSAAEPPVRGALPGPAGDSRLVPSPTAAPPSVFDLTSWRGQGLKLAQMGLVLKESTSAWQFLVGDWFLEGEQFLGEEVYGHIEELGFPGNTLRQWSWVAAKVSPDTRVPELDWTFHRAVAGRPPPEQKLLLAKAKDENLTTRQFSLVIHGPPEPKVKRWTLEELQEHANHYGTPNQRAVILAFLEWQAQLPMEAK